MQSLKAWLRPNHLTEDKGDYVAVPHTLGSLTVTDIVKELQQEGMEIKPETVIDIISRFNRKTAERVLQGYTINTGLVYMRPVIKGKFYSKTWDPKSNSLYIAINQGKELRRAIAETSVEILGEQREPMAIYVLTDKQTGKTDGTLTKGHIAEIKGTYLKVVGSNESNGVVFRNIATKEETKLSTTDIVMNEPSRLMILVPATLESGEYELTVTTQYSSGKITLREPRTMAFDQPVVIE